MDNMDLSQKRHILEEVFTLVKTDLGKKFQDAARKSLEAMPFHQLQIAEGLVEYRFYVEKNMDQSELTIIEEKIKFVCFLIEKEMPIVIDVSSLVQFKLVEFLKNHAKFNGKVRIENTSELLGSYFIDRCKQLGLEYELKRS